MTTCQIDGCDSPVFVKARGWCAKHYHRWHRTGDPSKASYDRASGTPEERWHAKVNKTETCWLWTGSPDKNGYGQFDVIIGGKHKNVRAHRWGYQLLVRPLSDDETLDHLCRVHACVRPDHLDPVPHKVNVLRGESPLAVHARKTHCPRGHEYDDTRDSQGSRTCRTCINDRQREKYQPRGIFNGQKTSCKHGHEFTPENTYVNTKGYRQCRRCNRLKVAAFMRRSRAAARDGIAFRLT